MRAPEATLSRAGGARVLTRCQLSARWAERPTRNRGLSVHW
ncbi:hypothetical protein UO65_3057 [Actinokineospora spheciospongiae]|uniref:Uncharacterized protein n=1 Tax=Actinokineospora spheciospongiae TaxID=909613 RepID=W7J6K4_9PSEU|nr:hypothetical protein UO65_3057 [Actinokineospora spheciospongiae]